MFKMIFLGKISNCKPNSRREKMSEELNKITDKISELTPEQKEEILNNFSDFKSYLQDQLAKGQKLGLSDDLLAKGAKFVADHLAKNEEPKNREQKVLQELWKVAEEDEKKTLAKLLVKMVQSD